jgi:putative transcriptional regulator
MKKTKLGQSIIEGLSNVIQYEKGKRKLRSSLVEIPDPAPTWSSKDIVNMRHKIFNVSQPIFANILSVQASTIKAWEQGRKKPSGAASRLLQIIHTYPDIIRALGKKSSSLHKNRP